MYDCGLFSLEELYTIIKNGIYATFLPEDEKDSLWAAARGFCEVSPKS
jgi:hypothetical protein